MTLKEACSLLHDYCCWSGGDYYIKKAEKLLAEHPDLDLMAYHNGLGFRIAISKGAVAMLKVLLHHFEVNQLKGDPYSQASLLLKRKLHIMLDEEVEIGDAPFEIQELLKPYIGDNDDVNSDRGLEDEVLSFNEEDLCNTAGILFKDSEPHIELTEVNLMALNQQFEV